MQEARRQCLAQVDAALFEHVGALLGIQEKEARWWRDACVLDFQTPSGRPLPDDVEQPQKSLEEYSNRADYYVPGIPERRWGP